MPRVVIENPVVNLPFDEPRRHVPSRRLSQHFMPIAKPRKNAKERQLTLSEVTRQTARLLEFWHLPYRARRLWISGPEAVQRKLGVKTVFDLSATPFFVGGSGFGEGQLFPWVVSDFSLIDAIRGIPQQQVPKCKS